ncbi:MAG: VWA domain-containing protein [Capsulimonadales bacterium]|nr:VWA domain-containing protein [Capsulimonadales bacterium]
MIMCPVCGSGNTDTAKFCSECGKALSADGASAVVNVRTPASVTMLLPQEAPAAETGIRAEVEKSSFPTEKTVAYGEAGPPLSEATQVYAPNVLGRTVSAKSESVTVPASESTPTTVVRPTVPGNAPQQPGAFPDFRETLDRIRSASPMTPMVRKADILFVVDCTGSMQGEIDAIRDTILDFVAEIERDGIRVRVGLLAFGDRFNGEESFVFRFDGEAFTKDASVFRREVSRLRAGGGGDIPESSLDALLLAVRQPFAEDASRVIVLVTDAPPHIPDVEAQNIDQVIQAVRSGGIKQLYLVIRTQDPTSGVYLSLLEGTQGLAFELGSGNDFRTRAENFKKTLRALGRTISTGTR